MNLGQGLNMLAGCKDAKPLMLRAVGLGQGLSVLIALTGIFSSTLVREVKSIAAPGTSPGTGNVVTAPEH